MNYRIEAPDGIWTKKMVETHLGGDAYLRVVITHANLKAPIVVESADLERRSWSPNHRMPVPVINVEVIAHRAPEETPGPFTEIPHGYNRHSRRKTLE